MKVKHLVKWILVTVYVATTIALIGCTEKQDLIHSNSVYSQQSAAFQQELIPEMGTPLAAPKMHPSHDVKTINFVSEFQPE